MDKNIKIMDADIDIIKEYGICGYKNPKKPGYSEKINWLNDRFKEGLKIKILYSVKDKAQGMIEYIPGEYCWRPVQANGYLFIHCIYVGLKKVYKNNGYGTQLIQECIKDAKTLSYNGVAVVTRKGSFMANRDIFIKNNFEIVDQAGTDFELLVYKLKDSAKAPYFILNNESLKNRYNNGLTIIRADQCPYTVKNVNEIAEASESNFKIKPNIITLKNYQEAQQTPCSFGTFSIIYDGKLISEHPISKNRFINIMNKLLT